MYDHEESKDEVAPDTKVEPIIAAEVPVLANVAPDVQPQVEEYRPVSKPSKPSKPKANNPVRSILFPVKKQRFFKVA